MRQGGSTSSGRRGSRMARCSSGRLRREASCRRAVVRARGGAGPFRLPAWPGPTWTQGEGLGLGCTGEGRCADAEIIDACNSGSQLSPARRFSRPSGPPAPPAPSGQDAWMRQRNYLGPLNLPPALHHIRLAHQIRLVLHHQILVPSPCPPCPSGPAAGVPSTQTAASTRTSRAGRRGHRLPSGGKQVGRVRKKEGRKKARGAAPTQLGGEQEQQRHGNRRTRDAWRQRVMSQHGKGKKHP